MGIWPIVERAAPVRKRRGATGRPWAAGCVDERLSDALARGAGDEVPKILAQRLLALADKALHEAKDAGPRRRIAAGRRDARGRRGSGRQEVDRIRRHQRVDVLGLEVE